MTVEEIVKNLSLQGTFKTDEIFFESALYFHAAIALNVLKMKKETVFSANKNINYYGLLLSSSGSGKDFAFKLVKDCFNADSLAYAKEIENGIDKYTAPSGGCMMMDIIEIDNMKKQAPKGVILGLEGTKEGIFARAYAQSVSGFGSLNITHPEFGDILLGSAEMVSKLKELYDSSMTAKITKGDNLAEINDITVNMMAYGSQAGIAHQTKNELAKLVKTGMFRRTFIIDVEPKKFEKHKTKTDITATASYLADLYEACFSGYLGNHGTEIIVKKTEDAMSALVAIHDELIEISNEDITNEVKKAEVGALTMIENLSHIISFIEYSSDVKESHVQKAYSFYKRCRETTKDSFSTTRPYMVMYRMISLRSKIAASEMIEKDNSIPTMKKAFEDELELLKEHCYIKGKKLVIHNGKVVRYSILELPENDNSDMIVSINMDKKGKFSIDYNLVGVPFFGKHPKHSIESLVSSPDVESFLTVEVKPSAKAIHGHRSDANAVEGQNMIAFDIDEGMTIDEAVKKLKPYTHILYTTKSHRKDKGGVVCDRFRVLMPTKQKFFLDPEAHKSLYENVSEFIGFQVYDKSTRNISRFWFTNESAEVITHQAENIDISALMPETEAAKVFSHRLEEIDEKYNDASVRGFYKWFFANTSNGNRNDNVHKLGCFMRDLGEDQESHMRSCNAMLDSPMGETELNHIVKSVAQ